MMANLDKSKVVSATKWSAVTEVAAKLVSPISTMILARLLTPDAFGVLVTATIVISFAEIFTDAGFQKYIIQHEFEDDDALYKSTAVAFWSNLIFSLVVWAGICAFSPQIAHLVGSDGYGLVIAVSCICIPLEAFSSIQFALFKRKLDFRSLFFVRIIGIAIPLIVTIPLAYITRSYWSLIIGMIALNIGNAILLTSRSSWKPKWYYNFTLFKQMFSFTMWSMVEAVTIWFTGYLDIFIVGTVLSTYYMGVYRTAINTVGGIMALITAATTSVLFSALSRVQSEPQEFKILFLRFQKIVGLLVIPLGVGVFLFRDFVTNILLGDQWTEASNMIGWWGLTSAITIVLSHYCSEVYRAKGKPKYSVVAQISHLFFLVPTVLISVKYGFETLCVARSLVRLTLIGINLLLLYVLTRISAFEMLRNILPSCISALAMCFVYFMLPTPACIWIDILYVLICVTCYLSISMLFKSDRNIIENLNKIIKK